MKRGEKPLLAKLKRSGRAGDKKLAELVDFILRAKEQEQREQATKPKDRGVRKDQPDA